MIEKYIGYEWSMYLSFFFMGCAFMLLVVLLVYVANINRGH